VTGVPSFTPETEFTKEATSRMLASKFSKDFSTLGQAYGFLSQNSRFHFAIHKRWTKVLDF
jgi:hypothetical protein